jgi:hypothetical protein
MSAKLVASLAAKARAEEALAKLLTVPGFLATTPAATAAITGAVLVLGGASAVRALAASPGAANDGQGTGRG